MWIGKIGVDVFRQAEKSLMLQVLDQSWKDHLLMLDQMRQSIGLRAYAQKDPLNEYKREAFELFEDMLDKLRKTITSVLSNIEIRQENNNENQQLDILYRRWDVEDNKCRFFIEHFLTVIEKGPPTSLRKFSKPTIRHNLMPRDSGMSIDSLMIWLPKLSRWMEDLSGPARTKTVSYTHLTLPTKA